MAVAHSLADMVRAELARRRMTQAALAQRLGKSQPWVSRRLSGQVAFSVDDVKSIAAVLGVSMAQLLTEDAA